MLLPDCLASCAPILSPVSTISIAKDLPTARGSLWLPPAPKWEQEDIDMRNWETLKEVSEFCTWKKAQFLEKLFTRDGSQQNLWLAKLSFLSCIDDVTHHCQFTASTQLKPQKEHHEDVKTATKDIFTPTVKWKDTYSKSIDGCDNRFPHGGHPVPVSQEVPTITLLEGSVLHLLNVSSRCKTRESTHKSIFF